MVEKLEVAQALADLNVDVIEAEFDRFPGDFEAVRPSLSQVEGPVIARGGGSLQPATTSNEGLPKP